MKNKENQQKTKKTNKNQQKNPENHCISLKNLRKSTKTIKEGGR